MFYSDKDNICILIAILLSYLFEQISVSFHISILHIFFFINLFGLYLFLKNISVSVQINYNV